MTTSAFNEPAPFVYVYGDGQPLNWRKIANFQACHTLDRYSARIEILECINSTMPIITNSSNEIEFKLGDHFKV